MSVGDRVVPHARVVVIALTVGGLLCVAAGVAASRRERQAERFSCPADVISIAYANLEPFDAPPRVLVTPDRIERRVDPASSRNFATEGATLRSGEFASVVRATCEESHPIQRRSVATVGGNVFLTVTSASGAKVKFPMKDRDTLADPTVEAIDELARRHLGGPEFDG